LCRSYARVKRGQYPDEWIKSLVNSQKNGLEFLGKFYIRMSALRNFFNYIGGVPAEGLYPIRQELIDNLKGINRDLTEQLKPEIFRAVAQEIKEAEKSSPQHFNRRISSVSDRLSKLK